MPGYVKRVWEVSDPFKVSEANAISAALEGVAADSGWITINVAGSNSTIKVRKMGQLVSVRWTCSKPMAENTSLYVGPASTLPATYRPSSSGGPCAASIRGYGGSPFVGLVGTDGSIYVTNRHTATVDSHIGSATYLV